MKNVHLLVVYVQLQRHAKRKHAAGDKYGRINERQRPIGMAVLPIY